MCVKYYLFYVYFFIFCGCNNHKKIRKIWENTPETITHTVDTTPTKNIDFTETAMSTPDINMMHTPAPPIKVQQGMSDIFSESNYDTATIVSQDDEYYYLRDKKPFLNYIPECK